MDQNRSAKDSMMLIFLSIIALLGVGFFTIRLWFPDLLSFKEEKINTIVDEEIDDDDDIPKISAGELKTKFDNNEDFILIDVQNTEDYIQATIPTAISIPLTEIDQRYEELPKNKQIIATDAGGSCQECSRAVEILRDYGFADIKKLNGGVNAWSNAGYPVINGNEVTFKNINSDILLDYVDAGEKVVIIDVRDKEKYDAGHIVGAIHMPFEGLAGNIDNIPKNKKIVIYDESGNRSKIAIKQFIYKGYMEVANLLRGYKDWQANNYPTETK